MGEVYESSATSSQHFLALAPAKVVSLVKKHQSQSSRQSKSNFKTTLTRYRTLVGREDGGNYIGQDVQSRLDTLDLSHPIEHGVINNWDDMEAIWSQIFAKELGIDPAEHSVLLTDAPLNPKANREKMAEIMFDHFSVTAFHVSMQPVLSLYASGNTSGLVLDSGEGVSYSVPIYEGYAVRHAINKVDLAGKDVTNHLINLLKANDLSFTTPAQREVVRQIKEDLCYVAVDYDEEKDKASSGDQDMQYTLPDGQVITIGGQDRFEAPEALFKPDLIGSESTDISTAVFESIQHCDIDIRKELYGSVVLAGGNTMFNGLAERLRMALNAMAPPSVKIKVQASPERQYSAWIGGSMLASLSTFQEIMVTSDDYAEEGPTAVHRKY
ncbi:hypothetical protein E3P99_02279 [Wallemia hederae]|uniref:Centractin n=1 Tax=Wallemia hederae TaxID=1540922 RepID=A0A4T0FMP2_9BASI|nr:hypothetical protein E3P99_02279 [Wallemia hederae]